MNKQWYACTVNTIQQWKKNECDMIESENNYGGLRKPKWNRAYILWFVHIVKMEINIFIISSVSGCLGMWMNLGRMTL